MFFLLRTGLRTRWVELLCVLGAVAVVVAAVLAQRAVTASSERGMHELAHQLGSNILVLPRDLPLGEFYGQRYGKGALPDDAGDRLRASPIAEHLREVQPQLLGRAPVSGALLTIVGEQGDWPVPSSPGKVPVALGSGAATRLGAGPGSILDAGGAGLLVVAVVPAARDGLDDAVWMPLPAAQAVLGRPGEINALRLGGCWCKIDVPTLARLVEQQLPGSQAITVTGVIAAQKGTLAVVGRYSTLILGAGLLVVIAIAAAFVAAGVRRRRCELGLLMAVGASPWRLAWWITAEAAVAGALAALLGAGLAIPLAQAIARGSLVGGLEMPAGLAVPAVAFSALASALGAAFAVRGMASLDPTDVLREA